MYAVINTFGKLDNYLGFVISLHKTDTAAIMAEHKLNKSVRRNNGSNSYLPTIIVELKCKYNKGQNVHADDVIGLDYGYAIDNGQIITWPLDN